MKFLRIVGLVSVLGVCSLLKPFLGLETARAGGSLYDESYSYGCYVDCCETGWSAEGFGDSVDEAWRNVTCSGHGGMCGTIECEQL